MKFKNDFGDSPGIIGRIIPDAMLSGVFGISAVIAGTVFVNPLLGAVLFYFSAKDVVYLLKRDLQEGDGLGAKILGESRDPQSLPPTTIDVPVQQYSSEQYSPRHDYEHVPTVIQANAQTTIQGDVSPTVIQNPNLLDVAKHIIDNIYSYAVIAPSGGGKGMLMSHVAREYKKRWPDRPIVLIDPKDDPKESGYWQGVVDVWHKTNFRKLEIEDKSAWLNEGLDIIRGIEGPHLAILDESTMVFGFAKNCDRNLANRLIDFMTSTASGGNSAEEYVFLMGHSGNLSDYGISGGQMSSFRKIYIAPNSNEDAIIQLGNTTFAGGKFGEDGVKQITDIASISPVDRAVYVGTLNKWFPMSELQNHSGFSRDKREITTPQSFEVVTQPIAVPFVTVIEPDQKSDINRITDKLISAMTRARSEGRDILSLTPDQFLLQVPSARKAGITLEQATIIVAAAKKRLGVPV